MEGFGTFLKKELTEVVRTWRMWVVPLIAVAMGAISPVFAAITPALLESVAEQAPGMVFSLPEPTIIDAFLQLDKNLMQIVLFAVIISTAGTFARERSSGTAVLMLTKPLSRTAMIVAKVIGDSVLVVASAGLAATLCWLVSLPLFDTGDIGDLLAVVFGWVALALMLVAITTMLGVLLPSQAGAAGVGLVVYLALAILGAWGPARDYSPAGLMSAGARRLMGEDPQFALPVVGALVIAVVATAAAALILRRREL